MGFFNKFVKKSDKSQKQAQDFKDSQKLKTKGKERGYIEKKRCLAILVFEGESDLVNLTRKKAVTYAKKQGGFHLWSIPAKSWIKSRYESPYLRDPILDHGILLETFETSTTWEKIIPLL